MMTKWLVLGVLAGVAFGQGMKAHPRDGEIHDADTKAWWHTTEDLSSDAMEGRDTGSAAYARAAQYVADRFKGAGLVPAGESGTYFQDVPLHELEVTREGTTFTLVRAGSAEKSLRFLEEIDVTPGAGLPAMVEGGLVFRGYCGKDEVGDLTGKIAVCFGARRPGVTSGRDRVAAVRGAGAVGMVSVDDPAFTIEPPRWPDAYSRSVTIAGGTRAGAGSFVAMRLSAPAFATMLEGSGQDAKGILALGGASKALPSFDLNEKLRVTTHTAQKEYSSPNVLAVLPGTDPVLKSEYIVIAAHLDGYGHGTPVAGDSLYNGTLDDAAYVALILQFAEDQKALGKAGGLKRSVLFCAFTGEEKGLLGSTWFTQHPTVPKEALVGDINLDQLRPLFPLKILTALAVDESTIGATAKSVAGPMGIEIRADREPERNLLLRADHWPFMQIGVPSIGFIFGYDPGTDAERRYRQWYTTQYHRPQDDLTQPMDFDAAAKFDTFFYTLTRRLANDAARPAWTAGSKYAATSK
ncbi:M28 family peptidase [Granulicella tundricola]|uniref:Peptidase M28 n=1 Tax=Granulicella tundricola (strain ATCC BAA-1859 / DSM 23138 / MP5ACTX9) TaxID=1198114 RepID=E8WV72_GRATM|nr:M28 family peptidase [Granulicella tundricola]ADW67247.1 peptidase M28 [Granulicella tundricola MP5ACTX9]